MATFPTFAGLTLPVKRTPTWRTLLNESVGGVVIAVSPWTYPRYRYELPLAFLRQSTAYGEIQQLIAFFNTAAGRGLAFQYNDPQDSTSGTDQLVGTGTSTVSTYQFVRAFGGYTEPVFAVSTTSTAYVIKVGSTTLSTAAYTVSNRGVLTLSSAAPSGQAVQWNGTFNWWCRFSADEYTLEQFTAAAGGTPGGPLWTLPSITFDTVKFGA